MGCRGVLTAQNLAHSEDAKSRRERTYARPGKPAGCTDDTSRDSSCRPSTHAHRDQKRNDYRKRKQNPTQPEKKRQSLKQCEAQSNSKIESNQNQLIILVLIVTAAERGISGAR